MTTKPKMTTKQKIEDLITIIACLSIVGGLTVMTIAQDMGTLDIEINGTFLLGMALLAGGLWHFRPTKNED